MTTLIEFLTARLDEDEAVAQASITAHATRAGSHEREEQPGVWIASPTHNPGHTFADDDWKMGTPKGHHGNEIVEPGYDTGGVTRKEHALHIARHDPARVLREVAAKRAILELAEEASGLDMSVDHERRVGPRDMEEEPYVGDLILRQLAAAWSDHPEFNPEWTVTS